MNDLDPEAHSAPRLVLVNPNSSAATTETMRAIAQETAGARITVIGLTARRGEPLITTPEALARAADAVAELAPEVAAARPDGAIVSAFGDPGLPELRARLAISVTGIAEAAMREAGAGGRPFAVVTTTPELVAAIESRALAYGHGSSFRGVTLTQGDVHAVMRDPERLIEALAAACAEAIERLGAEALVIGGGPLAAAAKALSGRFGAPIVAPIPAAVRLALARAAQVPQKVR